MFNINRQPPAAKIETRSETAKETAPEVLELLKEKVLEALAENPEAADVLTAHEIDMVTNYVALAAEKRGEPYTLEGLESSGDELKDFISKAVGNRIIARETPPLRITDSRGTIVGSANSTAEAITKIEEERAQGDRRI